MAATSGANDTTTSETDTTDGMYEQLIAVNREAFAEQDYDTACHTLVAALHRAYHLGTKQQLAATGRIAVEQMEAIDHQPPADPSAPASSVRMRTLHTIYSSVVRQASVMSDML